MESGRTLNQNLMDGKLKVRELGGFLTWRYWFAFTIYFYVIYKCVI